MKLVIGEQPPVPELEPQQAQGRFQRVFRRFIGVFATAEHPLALFLDDLQWLDAATLDLIEDLLTQADVQHLLLIGAYRANEVDAAPPLMRKLTVIRRSGSKVSEIELGPLDYGHIGRLIADALHCDLEDAASLSELVHAKTAGNPFFVLQFLHALADERLLAFDHQTQRWSWDVDRIRAKAYTDNVVDLMVGKLARLPDEAQMALQQLACLGNVADVTTLAMVLGTSEEDVHAALWQAVLQELVERTADVYRYVHDRIQEAAYSLIPDDRRALAHLRIGRLLAEHIPSEKREEAIFEIVNHLNRGAELITSQDERERLAELNLIAGKRAKASTAYASALTYLASGAALAPEDAWERRRDLVFDLELHHAECEFLTGALTEAEERATSLSARSKDCAERAAIASLRMEVCLTLGQSPRAVEVAIEFLRGEGIELSSHPTDVEAQREYDRVRLQIGSRTADELLDLPLMTDPTSLAILDVLTKLVPAALFTDANLYCLATCKAVGLSLERGYGDGSCPQFEWFGLVAGTRFADYKAGFLLGQVGYALVEGRGLQRFKARTYMLFAAHVIPWANNIKTGRDVLRSAFDSADKDCDITFAQYSLFNLTTILLASGDLLGEIQEEAEQSLKYARRIPFQAVIDIMKTQLALIKTLRGLTYKFGFFDDDQFDERRIEERFKGGSDLTPAAICWYWIRKLQARFFAGDYDAAIDALLRAQQLFWATTSMFESAEYHFYGALSRAARYSRAPTDERRRFWMISLFITDNYRSGPRIALKTSRTAPPWSLPKSPGSKIGRSTPLPLRTGDPVGATKRIRPQRGAGQRTGGALLRGAWERDYLSCLHAKCSLLLRPLGRRRQGTPAQGAVPGSRGRSACPDSTSTVRAPVELLDLATVIKVSQAVSGEIVLEKLIDTLMRNAIEQAGAERGLLILPRGGEQRIEAEAMTSGDLVSVHLHDEPVTEALLPQSVLHFVLRTRESVTLDDAAAQSAFAADPYIRERQARSVLCLPLINQTKLTGVLYLENNLARSAFAPARIAVLKLLASQAAMALENTRLYRDLAEREAKIRRLVDANIIGIFIWNFDGRILEANDAFLRLVGYEREDLLSGRISWTDLTPLQWRDRNAQTVQELTMTGIAPPYEKEYFRKDGSRVPVLIGAASLDESENQGVAFVLDLTERKQAEEALRESEEQWKAVFENNPTMYFMVGQNGTILSVNPFGAEQLGYAPEELIGHPVEILFHQADRELARMNKANCLEHLGRTIRWELRKLRKDGEMLWVRETGRAMVFKDRPVVLVVSEDITEGKRAAEALRETQTQLAHANRVETMGQLTASIAHEVNQPIAATLTNAQAALRWLGARRPNLDEARQALSRIVRDADRARAVVQRIRNLSKKAPPRDERVDINAAIREVIELTHSEAMKTGVRARTEFTEGLPLVSGDRVELQQVIMNLILNAFEAMTELREGPRELLVTTGRSELGDVLVAVRDLGPGLAPATLENLFKAFHTTKPKGLGLGLSICRSIIEAHGGRLWASANAPRGAVFQFTLPAQPDVAPNS